MKALFVCDDKEDWALLNNLFKAHFSKVELVCALKGSAAMDYLSYEGPFGIILIDTALKEDHPSELACKMVEISGERPIIFMGEHSLIKTRVDEKILLENEMFDLLVKPYDIETFKEVINSGLEWAREEEFEQSVEEFDRTELLPMKLRNFYLFDKIPYDTYLELTQTKFIKVISADKPYTQSMLQSYSKRSIRFLYLKKNEYLRFLEDSMIKIKKELSLHNQPIKKVLATQVRAALVIHQYIRTVGVSENIIELSQMVIDKTGEVFHQTRGIKKVLANFPRLRQDFAEHSILTMYFTESICEGLGWTSELTRKKLGLAALLQDSTLSNEDFLKIDNLESPTLQMFTEEEKIEFAEHPKKSAELALYFSRFPETDFIILQHHELPNGEGFPQRLNANKLTILSCVFALASQFVGKLVTSDDKSPSLLSEVFSYFKANYNTGNFKDPLAALEKMLKKIEH